MLPYAAQRGWSVDVVTLDPAALAAKDQRRLEELPAGTRVFAAGDPGHWATGAIRRASQTAKAFRRRGKSVGSSPSSNASAGASAPLAVPREELRWFPPTPARAKRLVGAWLNHAAEGAWAASAVQIGRQLASRTDYDAIISCGPPHAIHAAAADLARELRLPFVMDLRDPWSRIVDVEASIASPLWYSIAERRERKAVNQAMLVVMNTEPACRAMKDAHPSARDRIITARNGCDDEHIPAPRHGRRFTIAYAGSIYLSRDPRPFLRAASRVIDAMKLTTEDFGIAILGQVEGAPIRQIAAECGISDFLTLERPRPRREALDFLAQAAMLLNLPQSAAQCIPSKVFEYVQFDAWLLALEPEGTATEMLLRDSGADIVPPDDEAAIASVIRRRVEQYRQGVRPTPIGADGRFHRRHQAARLLDELERRLDQRRARTPVQRHAMPSPSSATVTPVG